MEFHVTDPKLLIEFRPFKTVLTFGSNTSDSERRL